MSLLLDALNKADQERKRNEATPGINSNHEGLLDDQRRSSSLLIIVLCIIVLLLAIGGAVYWFSKQSQPAPTAEKKIAAAHSPQPKASLAKSSVAASSVAADTDENTDSNNAADEPSDESVASLYEQTASTPSRLPELPAVQPAPVTPTQLAPAAATSDPTIAPPAQTSINQFANLPYIQELPRNILDKVPTLNYTQHNFNGLAGTVIINGVVHHVDDQLGNGLVIDKVLEDGMILHLDNYSFKIRALNSWVNM